MTHICTLFIPFSVLCHFTVSLSYLSQGCFCSLRRYLEFTTNEHNFLEELPVCFDSVTTPTVYCGTFPLPENPPPLFLCLISFSIFCLSRTPHCHLCLISTPPSSSSPTHVVSSSLSICFFASRAGGILGPCHFWPLLESAHLRLPYCSPLSYS